MATTGRPKLRGAARAGADARRGNGRFATRTGTLLACAAVALPLWTPTAASAQKWSVDAGISSELTWTSNAELGEASGGRDDGIFELRPRIRLRADGARLKLSGFAALSAITYVDHTQPSRLQPEADLRATLEAIERFLFLDAGVRALQTSANAFGARPEAGATSENSLTTTQARFAPRIEGSAGELMRYRLSSDNSWTRESNASDAAVTTDSAGYFARHSLSVVRDPRPVGWRIEAERSETRYRDTTLDPLVLDLARVTLDVAVGANLTLGIHGGRERTSFVTEDDRRSIYGFDASWRPSPRTTLSLFQEHRFFGSAWRAAFDHRTPQFAWSLAASRTLDTTPQSLFDLPATDNVAALLDAAFTTRYPDPIERARVVQDYIARQGLPTSTLQPITLRAQRLSLVTLRRATVALIGIRNSVALTAFQSRTEDAPDAGPFATGTALTNNSQYGASIAVSHRFTSSVSLIASADWSRITALESVGNDRSIQRTARVRLNIEAAPKTTAYGGARYRDFDSNNTSLTNGREGAIFVGVDHRF